MKTLTLTFFLTIVLLLLAAPLSDGLETAGEATCTGSWSGTTDWWWESSGTTITEKWEWRGLNTMYPYRAKSDKETKPE